MIKNKITFLNIKLSKYENFTLNIKNKSYFYFIFCNLLIILTLYFYFFQRISFIPYLDIKIMIL